MKGLTPRALLDSIDDHVRRRRAVLQHDPAGRRRIAS
jgi:hypothetical protein